MSLGPVLLFVPAHRPELAAKAVRFGPDVVVIDLEDAVPTAEKAAGRAQVGAAIAAVGDAAHVLVRVNGPRTEWFEDDLAAVAVSPVDGVVVPKLEAPDDARRARALLTGDRPLAIVAGIETARGVADARMLLAGGVEGAYFGAEDYVADVRGRRTDEGTEVLYARSRVALFARLAGIPAWDQAVTDFHDAGTFLRDAQLGRALGYTGKLCIHPAQVALAHPVFSASAEEIAHAHAVIEAAAAGVGVLDGAMVDEVHTRMARALLETARRDPLA